VGGTGIDPYGLSSTLDVYLAWIIVVNPITISSLGPQVSLGIVLMAIPSKIGESTTVESCTKTMSRVYNILTIANVKIVARDS